MQIHVTFKQMAATDALKSHAQVKTEKLGKFTNGAYNADWVLFVDADDHVAELRVHGPHVDCFAEAKTQDMYRSIEDAVDKVERQLRKHKETLKDHLHRDR